MAEPGLTDSSVHRKLLVADVPITDSSNDELGHRDVATLLSRVLEDWLPESQPLHIALYGPWGAGKSGVISLLKAEIAGSDTLKNAVYLLDFSLWKFGAENVRRGLLLFLDGREGLATETGMAERLSTASARTTANTTIDWRRFFRWLVIAVVCIAIYMVTPAVTAESSLAHRLFDKLISLGVVLSVAVGAISTLAKLDLQTQVSEGTSTPPPDRADQFQAVFEQLLRQARKRGTKPGSETWSKPQKLVLVFDDLDRVPPSLAWDVLTTIKTFMDAAHCVYIVPCDRDAVVEAMRSQSGPQIEARAIDFLDKFFQVSFNLPATYPREFRQIADQVCVTLSLPAEVATIAVAGFYRTPRSLKIFLNQVSLLKEFIAVRNDRLGTLQTPDLLLKVAKVHAIRVLWPACARAIADMPALMSLLEQRAQGIDVRERSEVADLADQFLSPTDRLFSRGLSEFLVATLGTAVGREAQSALKLSEAIWAEAHGDLDSLRTYLATGDSEGTRRLFEKGGVDKAVGVARDAFSMENQTATPETLVGWTGTLLQAFFGDTVPDQPTSVVDLTVEWASSPRVSPLLPKLPPAPLVRAIASSVVLQAAAAGKRVVDLAHSELTLPLPDYTVSLLRALSLRRERILTNHPELGQQIRTRLTQLATSEYRTHALHRIAVISQGVPGGEWQLWWDDDVGATLIMSVSGVESSTEDAEIVSYVTRSGYEISHGERLASIVAAVRLFQASGTTSLEPGSNLGIALITRIALSGAPASILSTAEAGTYSDFVTRLGDADQKLSALLPLIRLATSSDKSTQDVVLERGFRPSIPAFSSQHIVRLIDLLSDTAFSNNEGWATPVLGRCVELRDAALFVIAAEKSRNTEAIANSLRIAYPADEAIADSLMGRVQAFCDTTSFAAILEERVAAAGADVAATGRLIGLLQTLPKKPDLQNATWHTIATKLEQGAIALSEPGPSQALRRAVTPSLLSWLPEADQRHLADFATAVMSGTLEQPNDAPETILAKVEAGLLFESICDDRQAATLARGGAHVLAWPTLPPTAVSQIVTAITARPRILSSITDDAFDAIVMTRDTRTDEGRAFLTTLIEVRPAKLVTETKKKESGKKKRADAG